MWDEADNLTDDPRCLQFVTEAEDLKKYERLKWYSSGPVVHQNNIYQIQQTEESVWLLTGHSSISVENSG